METVFKALGDESRLRLLNLLTKGSLCVCELESALDMSQSNVSRHLTRLRRAGIVCASKKAQWVYYRVDDRFAQKYPKLYSQLLDVFDTEHLYLADAKCLTVLKDSGYSCEVIKK